MSDRQRTSRRRWLVPAVLALLLAMPTLAAQRLRHFDNPAQRDHYEELLHELRCLVCQDESLAASDADLAQDLRDQVYRLLVTEGRSRQDVLDFLTRRYGDFVLYRPPLQANTWALWFGPLLLLLIGGTAAVIFVRKRPPARALSPAEHAEARALLNATDDEPEPLR